MTLVDNPQGNYRFLTGIAPYSCGVVAMEGFEIVRVRLRQPISIDEQPLERISRFLEKEGCHMKALCAMELRIPEPLTFEGFKQFNEHYQGSLRDWGLILDDMNPIARTNIAPAEFSIQGPCVYAFSFTTPVRDGFQGPSFVVAGAGDLSDQTDLSVSAIVRPNEKSTEALKEKVEVVMTVMQERLFGLEAGWEHVSSMSIYTVIPLHTVILDAVLKPSGPAALMGTNWYYSTPPIQGLDYEMDMRGIRKELAASI